MSCSCCKALWFLPFLGTRLTLKKGHYYDNPILIQNCSWVSLRGPLKQVSVRLFSCDFLSPSSSVAHQVWSLLHSFWDVLKVVFIFHRTSRLRIFAFSALFFLLNIFPYFAVKTQKSVIVIIPGKEDEKGWLSSSSVEEEQVHVSWNQRPTWLSSERVSWQVLGEQKVTRTDVVSDDGCGLFWSFRLKFFILHISLPKVNNTSQL